MSVGVFKDLRPSDLGLDPAAFPAYRELQIEAAEWAAEAFDTHRFVAAAIPTGGGKSLFAATLARILGRRTVYLTITKALQAQYMRDFQSIGLVDIQGKSNYPCQDLAHLDCLAGGVVGCRYLKGKGCSYETAKGVARNAQHVVTNYAYWMGVNDQANGLERTEAEAEWAGDNPVELLVLDEGHDAADKLASYISCQLLESQLKRFGEFPKNESMEDWSRFAKDNLEELEAEIKTTQQELIFMGKKVRSEHVQVLHGLQRLSSKLNRLAFAGGDDWIVEKREGTKYGRLWNFDSVFPGKYAEKYLFCDVPRVLVMSATLKPKTMGMLGVKRENFQYRSWRRIFPENRCPIYMTGAKKEDGKTTIRIDNKTSKDEMLEVVAWLDEKIIGPRLDRKGLIHTVSYARAEFLMEHSKYRELMVGNTGDPDSESAWEVAEKFRKSSGPKILVSPSFGTGWDFADDACEYIVCLKVPFESAVSKIVKARCAKDPQYADYRAMQALEQAAGRGMRHMADRCEVILCDGHFEWFVYKNAGLAQDWFVKAIRRVPEAPKPPKKLSEDKEVTAKK